jgi:hypothetical protein
MQAIRTRYIGATNTRPSYISVKSEAGERRLPASDFMHEDAAYSWAHALGWLANGETLVSGVFAGDYYWTILEHHNA